MNKLFFLIQDMDSWFAIRKTGILSEHDGYISLLTRPDIADYVAMNQFGLLESYGLVEVDAIGILNPLEDENAFGITAQYQKRVNQQKIEPRFIKLKNFRKVVVRFLDVTGASSL